MKPIADSGVRKTIYYLRYTQRQLGEGAGFATINQ